MAIAPNPDRKTFYFHFPIALYMWWDNKGFMVHFSCILFLIGFGYRACPLPYFGVNMSFFELQVIPRIPMNEGGEYFLFKFKREWNKRRDDGEA